MIEQLKILQDNNLLTPISTVFTGIIAIAAVLINNFFIRRNLNRQIEAQSKESDKKIINDRWMTTREEKQLKLEGLFENLQQFLEALNESHKDIARIAILDTDTYRTKFEKLSKVRESYVRGQSYRRKAVILGYSYSDNSELSASLDELKELDEKFKRLLNQLTNFFMEASRAELGVSEEIKALRGILNDITDVSVKIKNEVENIEVLVTQEIRQARTASRIEATF
ncbi:hypothetical protein FB443_11328 [Vibrio crassostreae]|uniref:hypothetical protein n=1 Tax=Vibrio crassostreae TaxID=246167 RepID=UPI00115091F7|nr:hypothetical protein [Vibrio crassostreae]TQL28782.1 hypothetical protein FB443_11328 [Vibrio crassostreae]